VLPPVSVIRNEALPPYFYQSGCDGYPPPATVNVITMLSAFPDAPIAVLELRSPKRVRKALDEFNISKPVRSFMSAPGRVPTRCAASSPRSISARRDGELPWTADQGHGGYPQWEGQSVEERLDEVTPGQGARDAGLP
jgi:hypothetical protein